MNQQVKPVHGQQNNNEISHNFNEDIEESKGKIAILNETNNNAKDTKLLSDKEF